MDQNWNGIELVGVYMSWNRMEWGMLSMKYWDGYLLEASSLARHCDEE